MINNSKISKNINQWHIEYDQNEFLSNENWLATAEKAEDILQLSYINKKGPILDVGFYRECYKIYVIYNNDWEKPKEVFESNKTEFIESKLYELIDKYANG
ncbi:hypothetical protein [uncultured Lacinutrix sp.]|uniref:hypothetical protein n=1 Tax=uncultured Lacinutrix sp. TaxID=574032 RepID=UPI00263133D9|nr:hypothetical protein [uncultured Lacinutrix sp.]